MTKNKCWYRKISVGTGKYFCLQKSTVIRYVYSCNHKLICAIIRHITNLFKQSYARQCNSYMQIAQKNVISSSVRSCFPVEQPPRGRPTLSLLAISQWPVRAPHRKPGNGRDLCFHQQSRPVKDNIQTIVFETKVCIN